MLKVDGYYFKKQGYKEFISELRNSYELIDLGVSSNDTMNLYGIKIGEFCTQNPKPTIFITGSVHGNEWEGSYSIKRFMEILTIGDDDKGNKEYIQKLKAKFDFYLIPVCNPHGFDNGIDDIARCNANGVDINRNFDIDWDDFDIGSWNPCTKGTSPWSEPESVIIRDKALELLPVLYIDVHSWRTFTIHGGYWGDSQKIYQAWIEDWEKTIKVVMGEDLNIINWGDTPNIQRWINRNIISPYGKSPITILIETDRRRSPEGESKYHLNALLSLCLHALEWYRTLKLPIKKGY